MAKDNLDHDPQALRAAAAVPGATHGDEVAFIFGNLPGRLRNVTTDQVSDEDRRVSAMMMAYWTNFAKSGDPNGSDIPALFQPIYADNSLKILDSSPRNVPHFLEDPMIFLDQYYNQRMDGPPPSSITDRNLR